MTKNRKDRRVTTSGSDTKKTDKKKTVEPKSNVENSKPQEEPTYASFEKESITEHKPESKVAIIVAIAVTLIIAVAATVLVMHFTGDNANNSASVDRQSTGDFTQGSTAEAEGEASSQLEGQWVEVTLTTGERYFGRMKEAYDLGGYLLWNVWYPLDAEDSLADWQRVGDEIHQPRPFTVLASSAVRTWQQLASDSEVLMGISASENFSDIPEPQLDEILNAAGHAVFLADGTVLFGILVQDGNRVGIQDGYYLVRTNPETGPNDPIESLDDLQLVMQRSTTSGLLNTLWIGSDALVMYQALSDDSRIVIAIQEAQ